MARVASVSVLDGSSDPDGCLWMDAKNARRLCVVRFHARVGRRFGVSVGPVAVMVWLFFVGPLYVIFGLVWLFGGLAYLLLRWVVGPVLAWAGRRLVGWLESRQRRGTRGGP